MKRALLALLALSLCGCASTASEQANPEPTPTVTVTSQPEPSPVVVADADPNTVSANEQTFLTVWRGHAGERLMSPVARAEYIGLGYSVCSSIAEGVDPAAVQQAIAGPGIPGKRVVWGAVSHLCPTLASSGSE